MVETVKTRAALLAEMADGGNNTAEEIRNGIVSMYPVVTAKTADQTVTSSTVLENDDDLSLAVGANEKWAVRLVLLPECAVINVDLRMAWTAPSGATGWHAASGLIANSGSVSADARRQGQVSFGAIAGVGVVNTTNYSAVDAFAYIETGATAGTFQFQWAQLTSSASGMTLKKGSYLIAHQVNNP